MKALRSVLVVLATAAGASVVASAAYAASPADQNEGVIHGCVNDRSGVLRVIDPSDDEECRTRGSRKETAISWNEAGSETSSGLQNATSSGLQNLDQLSGLPCDVNSTEPGVVDIAYSSSGEIAMTCRKAAATLPVEPGVAPAVPGGSPVEPGVTPTQNGETPTQNGETPTENDVVPIQTGP
jgi:hypothetical protein